MVHPLESRCFLRRSDRHGDRDHSPDTEVIRWWHATACIGIIYNVEYSQTQAPKSRQLTAIHVSIRGATIRTIDPFPSAISCESMAGNSVPKSTVTLVPFGIVRTIRFM